MYRLSPVSDGPGTMDEQGLVRTRAARRARQMEMVYALFPSMRWHSASPVPPLEAFERVQPQRELAAAKMLECELPKLRYAYRTRRHTPSSYQPARFISLERIGVKKPPRVRFASTRPVSFWAIWRNISADLWLAETSEIIWPLFAAEPKSCGSNGMTATGSLSRAFAKSAGEISGRFGTPTWLRQ